MWIFTTDGFYSVVKKTDHDNQAHPYQIRGRRVSELQALIDKVPFLKGRKIHSYDFADYVGRIFVNEAEWQTIMHQLASEIDYENFKDAAGKKKENKKVGKGRFMKNSYTSMLSQVWHTLFDYQQDHENSKRKKYGDFFNTGNYRHYNDLL